MTDIDKQNIQAVQLDQCPSLSGRSTLKFELGSDPAKRLHLRVTHNTGKGHHNPAWVAYDQIEPLLMQAPTLSAAALGSLFQGTSVNTAGFVMAVLKHLGVIAAIPEQRHAYQHTDTTDWKARMQALIDSAGDPVSQEGEQASTSERSRSGKDDVIAAEEQAKRVGRKAVAGAAGAVLGGAVLTAIADHLQEGE